MFKIGDVYRKAALEFGLNEDDVKEAYNLYWSFFRTKIEELPLKDNLSEEEFLKLRTNFNVPLLGKIYCTYDRYLRVKNRLKRSRDAENN